MRHGGGLELLEYAATCEAQATAIDPAQAGADRAWEMVTATAAYCRLR